MFHNRSLEVLARQYPHSAHALGALRHYQELYNERIGYLVAHIARHRIVAVNALAMVRQYGEAIHVTPLGRLIHRPCRPEGQLSEEMAAQRIECLRKLAPLLYKKPLPTRQSLRRELGISFSTLRTFFRTDPELVISAYDHLLLP